MTYLSNGNDVIKMSRLLVVAPYYCAEAGTIRALRCMDTPTGITPSALASETTGYQNSGKVDATSNMLTSRVFIFQGQVDTVVAPGSPDMYDTQPNELRAHLYSFGCGRILEYNRPIERKHFTKTMKTLVIFSLVDFISRCWSESGGILQDICPQL